jgi:acetylornithine deacetylase/succinyl-diaminopimelate desuccinylase-like protein
MTQRTTAEIIDERFDVYLEDVFDLLRQPSVSSTGEGMNRCADLLCDLLEKRDFSTTRRIETNRYPLVYAENYVDESAPTVVFYGHYDVQPPGDTDRWETPAFEPTVRDGSIYARGSGDNKGQLVTHIFAVDALQAASEEPSINVKLLFEGGEENGSVGLINYLHDDPTELSDADLVYVADGPMHRSGRPTLIYGNRGILSIQLTHTCAKEDLHSGNFGGPIPNAANELVEVLASMYNGDRITVPDFYEDVTITEADHELIADIPSDEAAMRAELDIEQLATDQSYYERLLLEPTMTINGITSGYEGEGMKTIIPHRADAKLDMRLVPNQNPNDIFDLIENYIKEQNSNIEVTKMGTFPPMKTPLNTPAASAVLDALSDVWNDEPIEMPLLGGSLPAAHFRDSLDVPVLVVPYANPDQGNHSPNEHLDVDCLKKGIKTSARFIEQFRDNSQTLQRRDSNDGA